LPEGKYTIRATKRGYKQADLAVSVNANSSLQRITLTPKVAATGPLDGKPNPRARTQTPDIPIR